MTPAVAGRVDRRVKEECAARDAAPATAPSDPPEEADRLRTLARDYYTGSVISRDEFLTPRAELASFRARCLRRRPLGDDITSRRLYVANRHARCVDRPARAGHPFDAARRELTWRTEPERPVVRRGRPGRVAVQWDAASWLTGEETRQLLCGMGRDGFLGLVAAGRLRAWRGRGRRFRRDDVERLLETMRHRAARSAPGDGEDPPPVAP